MVVADVIQVLCAKKFKRKILKKDLWCHRKFIRVLLTPYFVKVSINNPGMRSNSKKKKKKLNEDCTKGSTDETAAVFNSNRCPKQVCVGIPTRKLKPNFELPMELRLHFDDHQWIVVFISFIFSFFRFLLHIFCLSDLFLCLYDPFQLHFV